MNVVLKIDEKTFKFNGKRYYDTGRIIEFTDGRSTKLFCSDDNDALGVTCNGLVNIFRIRTSKWQWKIINCNFTSL